MAAAGCMAALRPDRRSPEGKARVVAAMVEGRRKWVDRRRAEGRQFTAGRKGGDAWITEAMRERARAEAHRLGGGRFTLDRPLVIALLRSAKGDRVWEAKAKAMLDAHEQAEADRDRGQALSVVRDLRARAIAGWSGRAPVRRLSRSRKARARTLTRPRLTRRPDRGTTRPLPLPSCSGISSWRSTSSRKY